MGVYQEKASLISKVQLSLLRLPLYIPLTESILYVIGMGFFTLFLLAVDFPFSWAWLWLPVIMALVMLLAFTLGLAGAVLNVFIRGYPRGSGSNSTNCVLGHAHRLCRGYDRPFMALAV